ncbi:hypothetical protein SAMN05444355_105187 [Flavobacterium frigoris]|uniref:Uncharacterized protein n=2 Tax=Flavobacterium frigoris TaxID=229204 RepID=A0A1H9K806_FLAFI|nr:hypothetical protein SAMN05444355_105187 [Flavobacterium frigoris]
MLITKSGYCDSCSKFLILLRHNCSSKTRLNLNHTIIMKNQVLTQEEDRIKFSKILKEKMKKGFVIVERNDKLPFAVLSKKGQKVNHNVNFIFSCATLGLWSIPWMYQSFVSSREKRILVAIDEDGNTFEDKCF